MPLYGQMVRSEQKPTAYAAKMLTFSGTHSIDSILQMVKEIEETDETEACANDVRRKIFKDFRLFCMTKFSKHKQDRNFLIADAFDKLAFDLRETRMLLPTIKTEGTIKSEPYLMTYLFRMHTWSGVSEKKDVLWCNALQSQGFCPFEVSD